MNPSKFIFQRIVDTVYLFDYLMTFEFLYNVGWIGYLVFAGLWSDSRLLARFVPFIFFEELVCGKGCWGKRKGADTHRDRYVAFEYACGGIDEGVFCGHILSKVELFE